MTGYLMSEAEARRDLAALRRLPPLLQSRRGADPWTTRLAGIELHAGIGYADRAGAWIAGRGQTPLLITDRGMTDAGQVDVVWNSLAAAGLEPIVVDEVTENPTTEWVEATAGRLRDEPIDSLVALGGGSVLDAAKGLHLLLTQGGKMADYWGYVETSEPMWPSVAIPATAGTGSEAQAYAVLSHPESGRKMACGAAGARYSAVLLDPSILATAPPAIAAAAALDALSHAVESLVSRAATPTSRTLSLLAWHLLEPAWEEALAGSESALGRMALGAHLAGAAIEQSMLGAAHAAANPLTARCGVRHGVAVGLLLPAVVRFNGADSEVASRYEALGGAATLAARLQEIGRSLGLPDGLGALGVEAGRWAELAALATEEWTGTYNPRPLTASDFEELYRGVA